MKKALRFCRSCYALLGDEHAYWCPHGDSTPEPSKPYRQAKPNKKGWEGSGKGYDDGEPNIPLPPSLPGPHGAAARLPKANEAPKLEHKPALALPAPAAKDHSHASLSDSKHRT